MKKLALLTVLTAMTLPAVADNFYLAGDIGRSTFAVDAGKNSEHRTDTSYSIGAGYQFDKNFAVEVATRNLGKATWFSTSAESSQMDANALQISFVGSLPLGDQLNVYGRVGAAKLTINSDYIDRTDSRNNDRFTDTPTKAFVGVGASLALDQQLSLRVEYNEYDDYVNTDKLNLSAFTVGAVYKF